MPVRRSNEDLATALSGNNTFCNICNQPLYMVDRTGVSPCDHKFHLDCINIHLQESNSCPTCKQQCTLQLRTSSRDNLQAELLAADQSLNASINEAGNSQSTANRPTKSNTLGARGSRANTGRGKGTNQRGHMVTRSQNRESKLHKENFMYLRQVSCITTNTLF